MAACAVPGDVRLANEFYHLWMNYPKLLLLLTKD